METVTRIIKRESSSTDKKSKPVVINWGKDKNGRPVQLLRSQSVNACVNEIIEFNKRRQFLKINLVGASGSGKTSLMKLLAHQIHSKSEDTKYEIKFFKDKDLVDFKATVSSLSNNPQILCFDDLSGLVDKYGTSALKKLKHEMTTVRHINDLEDRRIIMMLSFHSQKMLDKQVRISNFTFYTDCELEEIDYLKTLLGPEHLKKIKAFQRLKAQAGLTHKFSYRLGRKNSFTYKDGDPFQAVLYSNGVSVRNVVYPLLEWVLQDNLCQTCSPAIKSLETKINLEEFTTDYKKKFTPSIAKRAIELELLSNGINTQPKRVLQAREYIKRYFSRKQINLEELAQAFNLKENTTKLFPNLQPKILEVPQ